MKKESKKKSVKLYPCHCNQCGYDWQSKKKHPKHCASCISDKWDKPLIGKKLRKAVPSRLTRGKGKKGGKVGAAKKSGGKGPVARRKGITGKGKNPQSAAQRMTHVDEPAIKPPRKPRVKKEKSTTTVEQTDGES